MGTPVFHHSKLRQFRYFEPTTSRRKTKPYYTFDIISGIPTELRHCRSSVGHVKVPVRRKRLGQVLLSTLSNLAPYLPLLGRRSSRRNRNITRATSGEGVCSDGGNICWQSILGRRASSNLGIYGHFVFI